MGPSTRHAHAAHNKPQHSHLRSPKITLTAPGSPPDRLAVAADLPHIPDAPPPEDSPAPDSPLAPPRYHPRMKRPPQSNRHTPTRRRGRNRRSARAPAAAAACAALSILTPGCGEDKEQKTAELAVAAMEAERHAASADTAQTPPPPRRGKPKVLVVGIDGLRADALLQADAPRLHALIRQGCFTDDANTGPVTVSGPGWSNILCGVWMDKHNSRDNAFLNVRYDEFPSFLQRIEEQRPELVTASFVDWMPIEEAILSTTSSDYRYAVDYKDAGDAKVTADAARVLGNEAVDAAFLYFADVDETGHAHGFHPSVPEYMAEIAEVDTQLARVLDAIEARPEYENEDWLYIVTTDHSGTIDKTHGRNEPAHRKIPFIVSGAAAARGHWHGTVNQTDVAATAFAHLGIDVKPEWGWDGRPVGLDRAVALGQNLIFNGDAEMSTGYADNKTDAGIAGWQDWGDITAVWYSGSDGFPTTDAPGPTERGRNFFCGGKERISEMTQRIDLEPIATRIDAGGLTFKLSGWFGGFATQRDLAWMEARWLDERGGELGRDRVGPVTLEMRREAWETNDKVKDDGPAALTGLLQRASNGQVPTGTRRVEIRLVCEAAEGDGDGYADNLQLVLGE